MTPLVAAASYRIEGLGQFSFSKKLTAERSRVKRSAPIRQLRKVL